MAKSRSRSPSWKHRQPAYRSPENHRQKHFQDDYTQDNGFRRNSRRPIHWEEGRHRQNNTRTPNYNRFNDNLYDKPYEQNSFPTNARKSPGEKFDRDKGIYSPERHRDNNKSPVEKFDREKKIYSPERHRHNNKSPVQKTDREKRVYSPERHRNGNERFAPPRYPEEPPYRDSDNGYYHRNQGHNAHDDSSDFRVGRREDDFHGRYPSENDWDWPSDQDQWNQNDEHLPPPRRHSQEFGDRSSFHKRFPEDHDFREPAPPFKRLRENERSDFREPHRNSNWKADHTFHPYHDKDWPKDMDLGEPRPFVHRTNTGEFKKIEYDYSHRSPNYAGKELNSHDDRDHKFSRHEERSQNRNRNSHHGKPLDSHFKDGGSKITERFPESSSKYNSKSSQNFNHDSYKNGIKGRPSSPRINDGKEDDLRKDPPSHNWKDKTSTTSDPKAPPKTIPAAETIMVNLALKNPGDKYRDGVSPSDRQMSQDLVATGKKESFHTVFKHLESSNEITPSRPKTEFTQEIITIIHEVKANHFKSTDLTLHDRFSNLKGNDSIQDSNLNITVPQTNPAIHRRIDISLEDLQSKSLNKRINAPPVSQRVIEDPNDLRHDIERRRKERLQSEENGETDVSFRERTHKHQAGDFQNSSKLSRPPFRKPTGRPMGPNYRGNPNQYYNSQNCFENTDGIRRPYKGQ
ncbi:hypothetical protein XENTR_v10005266 [Xenopus tropicalis]|uniref:BCLAF1 and THRAP3 family member 3 n=1 Tax=Xenopus tropicalis TaxID=8364 RepID=A0A6I8PMG9_XENTR|nr:BCLAF1 and THRAP3 family member 3 isoform X2 [Xenopus tropicalis]KAE8622509.1 hypothetical protein XENTR_v10005266 [Xenopus tropicalis]